MYIKMTVRRQVRRMDLAIAVAQHRLAAAHPLRRSGLQVPPHDLYYMYMIILYYIYLLCILFLSQYYKYIYMQTWQADCLPILSLFNKASVCVCANLASSGV